MIVKGLWAERGKRGGKRREWGAAERKRREGVE